MCPEPEAKVCPLRPLIGQSRSFQASDWLRASDVSPDPRDGVVRFVDHPVQLVTADQAVTEQLRRRELLIGQKCKYCDLIGQLI